MGGGWLNFFHPIENGLWWLIPVSVTLAWLGDIYNTLHYLKPPLERMSVARRLPLPELSWVLIFP